MGSGGRSDHWLHRAQTEEVNAAHTFVTVTANPSIERTHNGGPRLLASSPPAAPLCAAHVKR